MAAPAEPPAYCVGYGSTFFGSSSSSYTNIMLPCKMETSFSPPPSPSSSHSSLSLEPLPSSSSHSCCCLAEPFSNYNHLLSSSYTDIPTLLDTPSSCSSPSLFHLSTPPPSLKKRPASFLCDFEASAQLDGLPLGSKRICESVGSDGSIAYRSRETISSNVENASLSNGHNNELLDGAIWQNGCGAENVASGDLDDVLDLLLQEAEAVPTLTVQSSLSCHENSLLAYKLDHCKEESKEVPCKLDYCKEESEELYSCKPLNSHENDHLASSARSRRTWSDTLQDLLLRGQRSTGGSESARSGTAMQESQTEVKANGMSFCEELMKQVAPKCDSEIKLEQNDKRQEERRLQQSQTNSKTKQQIVNPLGASGKWAGPTLLDIESALAMTSPPSTIYPSSLSSPFENPPPTASSFLCSIRDILKQDPPSHFLSSFSCKEEPNQEEDDKLSTWRRLQKRNQIEPRYTVKIRCEEDAVNDGYRWRKYGQKSIKNSPYPRSYYRCSSGKCNVKKQVERSGEDAGLLLVSYEGIHLHHRPTSLLSPTPHTCAPPPPTCEPSFANPHPQSQ